MLTRIPTPRGHREFPQSPDQTQCQLLARIDDERLRKLVRRMKDAGAKLIVAGSEQESADYADRSIAAFAEAHERIGELLRTTYQTTGSPYGADSSVRRKFPSVRGSGHRPATLALLELINGSVG